MARKVYDFEKHRKESLEKIRANFGEADNSVWEERAAYWEERKQYFRPQGFMYIFDIRADQTILNYGFECLGYTNLYAYNSMELLGMIHENHRKLVAFQAKEIHETLIRFTKEKIGFNYWSRGLRAIKDKQGKYWLTSYTNEPFQYDANGLLVRYLTIYHLIGTYREQPLYMEFFHKDGKALLPEIELLTKKIRAEQLRWLGFTKQQLDMLTKYSNGMTAKGMKAYLDISQSTLNGHHRSMLDVARSCFPTVKFDKYRDIVAYLERQDLLVE